MTIDRIYASVQVKAAAEGNIFLCIPHAHTSISDMNTVSHNILCSCSLYAHVWFQHPCVRRHTTGRWKSSSKKQQNIKKYKQVWITECEVKNPGIALYSVWILPHWGSPGSSHHHQFSFPLGGVGLKPRPMLFTRTHFSALSGAALGETLMSFHHSGIG